MDTNTFLKIVSKELPSFAVYENDLIYAFLDTEPYSKGHTLIVPKEYCPDIENLDEKTATAILMAAKRIVAVLRTLYGYGGVVLHQVNGQHAQDVRHFHMHVYGTLSEGDSHFYKTLPNNQLERKSIFSSIAEEMSECIKRN